MKLKAELGGQNYELELRRDGPRVFAAVDGRTYELEAREFGSGEYLLVDADRIYECGISKNREHREVFSVNVSTQTYAIRLIDPKRLRSAQSPGGHDHGSAQIVAPMPGKVVRVLVGVGAQVEAGAGIIVVEAMKMQNEMRSPKAGAVVALNAEAGATVNAGDVLAVVE